MAEFNLVGAKTVDDLRELLAGSQVPDPTGLLAWLDKHVQLVEFASLPALGMLAVAAQFKPQFGGRLAETCDIAHGAEPMDAIPRALIHLMRKYHMVVLPPLSGKQLQGIAQ